MSSKDTAGSCVCIIANRIKEISAKQFKNSGTELSG